MMMNYRGQVFGVSALPSDPKKGDAYLLTDLGETRVWNGCEWITIANNPFQHTVQDRLLECFHALEPDARLVVLRVAERMLKGQYQYGRLTLASDTRDHTKELSEEIWDGLAYSAMAYLKMQGAK